MKQCSKCKEWKDESEFHKNKTTKDGLYPWCKECKKQYLQKNKEKISKQRKELYSKNKKKYKKIKREYYQKNREELKKKNNKYYHENKESVLKTCKEYREKNKEELSEKKKKYIHNNSEKIKEKQKKWRISPMGFNSETSYRKEIELYEEIKESKNDNLMCKCAYCGEWFEPSKLEIINRLNAINNNKDRKGRENRLYCSKKCKRNCPIYGQQLYQKDQKSASSREVQPELRQMVFKRDNYTCCNCHKHKDEIDVGLHCHHVEGILWEPLQSADIDTCISLCEECHKEVHQKEGCSYYDMQCAE